MDQTGFTGNLQTDLALTVVTKMVAGRVAGLNIDTTNGATGYAGLADGVISTSKTFPIGFIINDAAGYYFENPAAYASGMIAVLKGPAMILTDQWDTATTTITVGAPVFVGTSLKVGLLTPTGTIGTNTLVGIAMNTVTVASPNLQLLLLGF